MANIQFNYLYRDGGNYKKWAAVVFSNPDGLSCNAVTNGLSEGFLEDGLFIAHQIRIPEVFLWEEYSINADDHCFHEFSGVEDTDHTANDKYGRSIRDFIDEALTNGRRGWQAFEPLDKKS